MDDLSATALCCLRSLISECHSKGVSGSRSGFNPKKWARVSHLLSVASFLLLAQFSATPVGTVPPKWDNSLCVVYIPWVRGISVRKAWTVHDATDNNGGNVRLPSGHMHWQAYHGGHRGTANLYLHRPSAQAHLEMPLKCSRTMPAPLCNWQTLLAHGSHRKPAWNRCLSQASLTRTPWEQLAAIRPPTGVKSPQRCQW